MAGKQINKTLAHAMRNNNLTPNGEPWAQAKAVRDDLIAQGVAPKSACNKAAFRVARAEGCAQEVLAVVPEPVTQAPKADARPKRMPEQAKRVRDGKVARDAKGRILPAYVSEAMEELSSLARA